MDHTLNLIGVYKVERMPSTDVFERKQINQKLHSILDVCDISFIQSSYSDIIVSYKCANRFDLHF